MLGGECVLGLVVSREAARGRADGRTGGRLVALCSTKEVGQKSGVQAQILWGWRHAASIHKPYGTHVYWAVAAGEKNKEHRV